MTKFYIDVPNSYHYDWSVARCANEVICKNTNAKTVTFICNHGAYLSNGDIYYVELFDDDCKDFYILRTGFRIIPETPDFIQKVSRYHYSIFV